MLPALYAATLFVGAALLFLVQPLIGKLLLPLVGGTPSVWNTCMVFFQSVLLAGYLYAHLSTAKLGVRRQAVFHLLVLIVAVVVFKIAAASTGSPVPVVLSLLPDDQDPTALVFAQLSVTVFVAVGVPFFVLSTTAPLLQRWFATSGHPSARDPYFLYAASNAGSLVGLLAYPFVIERWLTLAHQQWVFAGGVFVYAMLVLGCALTIIRRREVAETSPSAELKQKEHLEAIVAGVCDPGPTEGSAEAPAPQRPATPEHISVRRISRWVALAALPSSLLLGVTTHVSTDIAPVPLLWVVPLSLYLLSFILVFARWPDHVHRAVGRFTPMLILFVVLTLLTYAAEPMTIVGSLHMIAFFAVCLLCHGELAKDRPHPEHLTAFYFWMSVGGVLGGLFNALVAPIIFSRLGMVEYPLALVLAALVRPRSKSDTPLRLFDGILVLALLGIAIALVLLIPQYVKSPQDQDSVDGFIDRLIHGGLMFGVPSVIAFALVRKPARYALALSALFIASMFNTSHFGKMLYTERNFFGVIRVSEDGTFTKLFHGTTLHGQERIDEDGHPRPMTYYHEKGPVGHVFKSLPPERIKKVGVVGLGTGAVAYYAQPGQEWTFYEIDPAIEEVAKNEKYFHFLSSCQVTPTVVLGDARRKLLKEPDGTFDLLILDAFSSDAIPVHLLTREALALYVRKLAPHGIILLHVSNHHLDLPPVVARLAEDHAAPLAVYYCRDSEDKASGKSPSDWMLLARDKMDLMPMIPSLQPPRLVGWESVPLPPLTFPLVPVPVLRPASMGLMQWEKVPLSKDTPLWRDDFADLIGAWKRLPKD